MEKRNSNGDSRNTTLVALLIFSVTCLVYLFTREELPTPYNNFVLLADAILNGRLHLIEDISWLELVPYEGKYYIVPPPFPAIVILPVVAFFGPSTDQTLMSILFGSVNVSLAFLIARALTKNKNVQLWSTVMFGFGTIHWWVATAGGVWTFSQTVSTMFLLVAILCALKNYHPIFTGLALGASYWSRLPTILSFPFFLAAYSEKWLYSGMTNSFIGKINLRPLVWIGVGTGFFVMFNFGYNHIRFDTPFDISYYLIPGVLEEHWYQKGIFDASYIPRHLKVIFLGMPKLIDEYPYIIPSWDGMAIWITTPAFIYAFFAGIRNKISVGCWLSIILIAIVDFCHGTWGFAQFGYRFALDFYPFLFLLTVKGIGNDLKWHHKVLITIGVFVNMWGVLWIHKFGWVGY